MNCTNIKGIKQCTVPISHFKGKKSGLFFTSHKNHLDGQSIFYEIPPVKVILPNSNNNEDDNNNKNNNNNKSNKTLTIVLCIIGGVILLAVAILLIIIIKRKRTSSTEIDTEKENIGSLGEN